MNGSIRPLQSHRALNLWLATSRQGQFWHLSPGGHPSRPLVQMLSKCHLMFTHNIGLYGRRQNPMREGYGSIICQVMSKPGRAMLYDRMRQPLTTENGNMGSTERGKRSRDTLGRSECHTVTLSELHRQVGERHGFGGREVCSCYDGGSWGVVCYL